MARRYGIHIEIAFDIYGITELPGKAVGTGDIVVGHILETAVIYDMQSLVATKFLQKGLQTLGIESLVNGCAVARITFGECIQKQQTIGRDTVQHGRNVTVEVRHQHIVIIFATGGGHKRIEQFGIIVMEGNTHIVMRPQSIHKRTVEGLLVLVHRIEEHKYPHRILRPAPRHEKALPGHRDHHTMPLQRAVRRQNRIA